MENPTCRDLEFGNFSENRTLLPFGMHWILDNYFSRIIVELVSVLESVNNLRIYPLRRKKNQL